MFRTRILPVAVLALSAVVCLAGCSSDEAATTTTTTTTAATSTTAGGESAATVRFDRTVQQELADVGCFPGAVDGVIGPKTDAAIVEFQKASGLAADGELGAATAAALKQAAEKGTAVCGSQASTTTTTSGSTTSAAPSGPPCTASAILEGIGGDPSTSIASFVCSGGYAAGTLGGGGDVKFVVVAKDGGWYQMDQDPCGSASAGLPAIILQDGCPE